MAERAHRSVRAVLAAMGLSVSAVPMAACGEAQVIGNPPPVSADASGLDAGRSDGSPADAGPHDATTLDVGNPPPVDGGDLDAGLDDAISIGNPPPTDSGISD